MSALVKLPPKWHVENFNVYKKNKSGKWKCSTNEDCLKEDGTISQSKRCEKI